jgi:zinc transport system substrate-binding protein
MKPFRLISIAIILSSLFLGACQSQQPQSEKPLVFVSIPPQKYFVERIAGDSVDVQIMVEPGAEPHTYEPKPAQMTALASADLYFAIGDSFEDTWLSRISETNPDLVIVDTAEGIVKRQLDAHHHEGEEDHTDEEEESGPDPHIWLSPRLVALQSQHIYDALVSLNPQLETTYTSNMSAFIADVNILDNKFNNSFKNVSQRSFMVYHPSWGYFADDYGLQQIAVEIGGTEPSPSELAAIIEEAKAEDIHVIFAQPEFNTRFADSIAEQIDGKVLLISPLEENWMENMETMGQALIDGLSGK